MRNLFFTNKLFFLAMIIVGMVVGAIYSDVLNRKYYKSTMFLRSDYLNIQILGNMIGKLNLLTCEKSSERLTEILKVNVAKNIQQVEFKSFVLEDDVIEIEVLRTQLSNVAAEKKIW